MVLRFFHFELNCKLFPIFIIIIIIIITQGKVFLIFISVRMLATQMAFFHVFLLNKLIFDNDHTVHAVQYTRCSTSISTPLFELCQCSLTENRKDSHDSEEVRQEHYKSLRGDMPPVIWSKRTSFQSWSHREVSRLITE